MKAPRIVDKDHMTWTLTIDFSFCIYDYRHSVCICGGYAPYTEFCRVDNLTPCKPCRVTHFC